MNPEFLNQIVIAIAIVLYIIVTSIAINRFHRNLERIKKIKTRFEHKYIDEVVLKETVSLSRKAIKQSRTTFLILLINIGLGHLFACFVIEAHPLSAAIPFVLFIFILLGNYWLKGSQVLGAVKNLPGLSDYHGF